MNNLFDKVHQLFKDKKYDEALVELGSIKNDFLLPPNISVLKGVCIQLGKDEKLPLGLEDAEKAYKNALEVDSEYINALLELGFFYLNVKDDATKALFQFKKAFALSRSKLTEAIQGYAECLSELESQEKALKFIEESINNSVDMDKLNKTIDYIRTGNV